MIKKLFLLPLMALCLAFSTLAPQKAEAMPAFFIIGVPTVAWAAFTYEDCKEDGLDFKECASKTWAERDPVNYDRLNK